MSTTDKPKKGRRRTRPLNCGSSIGTLKKKLNVDHEEDLYTRDIADNMSKKLLSSYKRVQPCDDDGNPIRVTDIRVRLTKTPTIHATKPWDVDIAFIEPDKTFSPVHAKYIMENENFIREYNRITNLHDIEVNSKQNLGSIVFSRLVHYYTMPKILRTCSEDLWEFFAKECETYEERLEPKIFCDDSIFYTWYAQEVLGYQSHHIDDEVYGGEDIKECRKDIIHSHLEDWVKQYQETSKNCPPYLTAVNKAQQIVTPYCYPGKEVEFIASILAQFMSSDNNLLTQRFIPTETPHQGFLW